MRGLAKRSNDRLELRLTSEAKSILKRAAAVEKKTMSAFVLDKGLEAAAAIIADRREFRMSAKEYDAFVAALNVPAKSCRRLTKLLTTASVLD